MKHKLIEENNKNQNLTLIKEDNKIHQIQKEEQPLKKIKVEFGPMPPVQYIINGKTYNSYEEYKNSIYNYNDKENTNENYKKIIKKYYEEMIKYFDNLENLNDEQKKIHNDFLKFIEKCINNINNNKINNNEITETISDINFSTFECFQIYLNLDLDNNIRKKYFYIIKYFNDIIIFLKYNKNKIINLKDKLIKICIIISFLYNKVNYNDNKFFLYNYYIF